MKFEKNESSFWEFNSEDYFYTVGGIVVDIEKNLWEFIELETALSITKEFPKHQLTLKEFELVNDHVCYGDFSIEEGANYVSCFQRETPEYIAIFSGESKKEIILNYMEKNDWDLEQAFKLEKISGKCLIIGVDLDSNGFVEKIAPLSFSTMQGIVKGCLALNESDLKNKQKFLKQEVKEYLSQF